MPRRGEGGFSLLMVMFFIGLGFLVMTGVLRYSGASSTVNERYNEYYTTLAAAEAATERVVAELSHYFLTHHVDDPTQIDSSLASYGTLIPTGAEWANYEFADASGNSNQTHVSKVSDWAYTNLNWKYSGFSGKAATYRVISNTRNTLSGNGITAAVKQDVQLAYIPLFEFGVFYALDMELHPGLTNWQVTGRVHSNGSIYSKPHLLNVTFRDHVTAAGQIVHANHPLDSWNRTFGSVTYLGERDSRVTSLNLPIGTTNTASELYKIIEIPPSGESPSSLMGLQRYCNNADLIILVTNAVPPISAKDRNNVNVPTGTNFFVKVATNTFYNVRENANIQSSVIDIQAFTSQYGALGSPKIIYVADRRQTASGTQSGVRIINGQNLPGALTIATMNPLYVVGHYNAPAADLGTTNTSATKPTSLIADAVTIVSSAWVWSDPNYGVGNNPKDQNAVDTTINAAIIAGIFPTAGGSYGGGVENYLRSLEDWNPGTALTLTFNGSIVTLFSSQIANGPWEAWSNYMATDGNGMLPNRRYSFDPNFKVQSKLPPGTPYLRTLIRGKWAITQANSSL